MAYETLIIEHEEPVLIIRLNRPNALNALNSKLLEELNNTLRPKIENPIREKPILAIAIAAGVGLLIGTLLNSGKK